jgi:hypothetical protein
MELDHDSLALFAMLDAVLGGAECIDSLDQHGARRSSPLWNQ